MRECRHLICGDALELEKEMVRAEWRSAFILSREWRYLKVRQCGCSRSEAECNLIYKSGEVLKWDKESVSGRRRLSRVEKHI
jgi:hypothetical protein